MGLTMTRLLSIIAGVFLLAPTLIFAGGDTEAGKAKAATCAACHGPEGISPTDQFPHIAGQVPGYIAAQLAAFKSGDRENAIMAGMVGGLEEQDMMDLDAYFSSLPANIGSISPDLQEVAEAGAAIYRGGVAEFSIPACMACHGPTGTGVSPTFPRVAGMSIAYLKVSLEAFKSGDRKNTIMNSVAYSLTDEQIEALAIYMSGLN